MGDLRINDAVYSPQLNNTRHILVWLPPTYATSNARFPVLYMHDGDNLFDAYASYAGEWRVDETLTQLAAEGIAAIVVGIPNMGEQRFSEYSPFPHRTHGKGSGDAYLRFLVETLKPMIDADFRTLPDATHTGIVGSSMGGLISLYGFLQYPAVFGMCGVLSPSFWYGEKTMLERIAKTPPHGRVYLDIGTKEGTVARSTQRLNHTYRDGVRKLRDALKAYDLLYVEDEGAQHNERAWARRLPKALRFLLSDRKRP